MKKSISTLILIALFAMGCSSQNFDKEEVRTQVLKKIERFNIDPAEERFSVSVKLKSIYELGLTWVHNEEYVVFENDGSPEAEFAKRVVLNYYKELLDAVSDQEFTNRVIDWSSSGSEHFALLDRQRQIIAFRNLKNSLNTSGLKHHYWRFCGEDLGKYRAEVLAYAAPRSSDNYIIHYLHREISFGDNQTIKPLLVEVGRRFGKDCMLVAKDVFEVNQDQFISVKLELPKEAPMCKINPEKFRKILTMEDKKDYFNPRSMEFYLR